MNRRLIAVTSVVLAAASSGSLIFAHATLISPKPRTKLTLKEGPCGGVPRTGEPLVVEAGSDLEVVWEEYVDHPGFYRILFSRADDEDFEVLLDKIPDRKSSFAEPVVTYTAHVTLPAEPCDAGTLLMMQVMTEDPKNPRYYYSCADIRVVAPALQDEDFRRGDANEDGKVDVSDAVRTFNFLFAGDSAPSCADAADSNDDGRIDISDGVFTLRWLFTSADAPASPGPVTCGADPTLDPLPVCSYAPTLCE